MFRYQQLFVPREKLLWALFNKEELLFKYYQVQKVKLSVIKWKVIFLKKHKISDIKVFIVKNLWKKNVYF